MQDKQVLNTKRAARWAALRELEMARWLERGVPKNYAQPSPGPTGKKAAPSWLPPGLFHQPSPGSHLTLDHLLSECCRC